MIQSSSITRAASSILFLCWHAVFAVSVVSAFASSSASSKYAHAQLPPRSTATSTSYSPGNILSSGRAALSFRSKARHHHHHGVLGAAAATASSTTSTRLHLLSIPRGGGTAAAATASASSTILATITSKMSQWTSTPNGAFNLVLVLLGMSTAVLKLYNRMLLLNEDEGRGDGDNTTKKDPKVKSLQLRFLTVFWLLRMADWLQVSTSVMFDTHEYRIIARGFVISHMAAPPILHTGTVLLPSLCLQNIWFYFLHCGYLGLPSLFNRICLHGIVRTTRWTTV